MKHYFISGTSRGIGKALAELVLKQEDTYVTGIARSQTISHPRYFHHELDLSDTVHLRSRLALIFQIAASNVSQVVLVNNAGMLGDIAHVGCFNDKSIEAMVDVNITSPALLMNAFLREFEGKDISRVVVNISSGAGRKPVEGWAMYCSSKAALDMMTQVAAREYKPRAGSAYFYTVAPGVVDTAMQEEIRQHGGQDFGRWNEFMQYKENGMLSTPEEIAVKLLALCEHPELNSEVVLSLKGRRDP